MELGMHILISCAAIILTLMIITFFIAQAKCNNSLIDIAWGLGFIAIAWFTLFQTGLFLKIQILATALVTIWGLRLSAHLAQRNWNKKEDPRYEALIEKWGPAGYLQIFVRIYITQAILLLMIASSIIIINTSSFAPIAWYTIAGLALWIFGFLFEVIADYQLDQFLKNQSNKGKIMQSGLWSLCRHPNYFGEITLWWGMFLITFSAPHGLFALLSPLTITSIFLFISIPLTEKVFAGNAAYETYKQNTRALIPWLW